MTDADVGPLSTEEVHIRDAADQAYRILDGRESTTSTTVRFVDVLRDATRQAPLQALAIAFILGVMITRRR